MEKIRVIAEGPSLHSRNGSNSYKELGGKTQAAEVLLDGIDTVRTFPGLGFFRFSERNEGVHIAFVAEATFEGLVHVFKGAREVKPKRRQSPTINLFSMELRKGRDRVAARYVNISTGQEIVLDLNHK